MNILNRIGKIIEANLKTALRTPVTQAKPRTRFSEAKTANPRNQNATNTSKLKDKKLEKAYAALEIPYGADLQTTKNAWKKLVKKYHPDLYSNDPEKIKIAHEVTQGLNDAFQIIRLALNKTQ
jgi:DnaJ-domain-containing protein 1